MKFITIKKNIFKKTLFLALIISNSSGLLSMENCREAKMYSLDLAAKYIRNIEQNILDILNTSLKAPLNTFLIAIKKTNEDFKQKGEAIKRFSDPATRELDALFEYVVRKFNVVYLVLSKYNGQPARYLALGQEIQREFNTEEIFGEILRRLHIIKLIFQQDGEIDLIKKIDIIISMVERKRKDWKNKSDAQLLGALAYRLQC